jgi:hypothetical protein
MEDRWNYGGKKPKGFFPRNEYPLHGALTRDDGRIKNG